MGLHSTMTVNNNWHSVVMLDGQELAALQSQPTFVFELSGQSLNTVANLKVFSKISFTIPLEHRGS
jgi:hypothetical protein